MREEAIKATNPSAAKAGGVYRPSFAGQAGSEKSPIKFRTYAAALAPVVVIVGAVIFAQTLAANKPVPDKTIEPPRPLAMRVEPARTEALRLSVSTQGAVAPRTQVSLVPEVSGRVVSVSENFIEGGAFAPGEVLLKIDDSNYRLAYTRAEARVAEAQVSLEQELADAKIKEKQWAEWVRDGEPTPLALNKPQVAEAQAKLRAAEADLEEARLNLERTKISLPFAGRVSTRSTGVGQFVNAGSQLGEIFATDVVEVRLPLTDKQLSELNLPIGYIAPEGTDGHDVELSTVVAGERHTWTGHIRHISAAVDAQTRLIYAVAEVEDPYGAGADRGMPIAVGLFVDANIKSNNTINSLVIPRGALRSDNRVYVINDGKKLEIRTVEVSASNDKFAVITAGLNAGDQVVTSPVRAATDGMTVDPIYADQVGAQTAPSNLTAAVQ